MGERGGKRGESMEFWLAYSHSSPCGFATLKIGQAPEVELDW